MRRLGLGMLAAVLSVGLSAAAEAPATLAEALFQEGRRLMEEGRVEEACTKFAESQRLDSGGGTLLNLAACRQAQGRLATAWSLFRKALAVAREDGRSDRIAFAEQRLEAIEPRLSRIRIELSEAAAAAGVELALDGEEIGTAAVGTPLPVDAGEHRLTARAEGRAPWSKRVVVEGEGETIAVRVPELERLPESDPPRPAPDPEPTDPEPTEPQPLPRSEPAGSGPPAPVDGAPGDGEEIGVQAATGWSVISLGTATAVVGGVVGGLAVAKAAESDDLCAEQTCPDDATGQRAVKLNADARSFATVTNALLVVSSITLGAGLAVLLTAPDPEPAEASLRVSPGGGSLLVRW